jgi:hypothetical protein
MNSVAAILSIYGVPYKDRSRDHGYALVPTWDGERLNISGPVEDDPQFVIHEISHFLIAPDHAKKLPNYGLGPDPGGGMVVAPIEGSCRGKDPYHDEFTACVLDLWLMHKHGWDRMIRFHKDTYSVTAYTPEDLGICRAILSSAGLNAEEIITFYEETEINAQWTLRKPRQERGIPATLG